MESSAKLSGLPSKECFTIRKNIKKPVCHKSFILKVPTETKFPRQAKHLMLEDYF
jgi:hypothetical protein